MSGFFLVQCLLEPLRQHCIGFFLCHVVWSLKDNIGLYLCNTVPEVLGPNCTGLFLFGDSWTTLHRILTCARLSKDNFEQDFLFCVLLSGASRATMHRVFICVILSQEYHLLEQHCTGETLCSVVLEAPGNIA